MSEKHIPRLEHHKSNEDLVNKEHHEKIQDNLAEQAERAKAEQISSENLEKIREIAKNEAEQLTAVGEVAESNNSDSLIGVQHSLKADAFNRTLTKIRHRLSKPDRAFSKLAHNDAIDKISAIGSQTIARPSGVLAGSICAFTGSSVLLYLSKHYGFRYNYLVFFGLFIGGFLLGSLLELVVWLAYTRKHRFK